MPASADGETTLDNLCLACLACNRYKGARQSAPDPETG
ncbi:MAG: HNH endonuclease [Anaerolineae bacterium]